jgi:hypothetical protein
MHRRGDHFAPEVRVEIWGSIRFSATLNHSRTPFRSYNSPLHRPYAPMTSNPVRTPQREPQWDLVCPTHLLVILALGVERLVTMPTIAPREALRILQCRVNKWGLVTRPRRTPRDNRTLHVVDWTTYMHRPGSVCPYQHSPHISFILSFSKSFFIYSNLEDEILLRGVGLSHPEISKFQDVNRKEKLTMIFS